MTWFTRLRNWTTDASNGIGIRADYHDSEDNNFATGINLSLNIAGQNSPTADIPWGTNKITGLKPGTLSTDAATLGQIQTSVANYAVDSSGTDAYAITLSPALIAYATGQVFRFYPATINTGAATLSINGLAAKSIKKDKDVDLADGDIKVGQLIEVIYDGTNFQMQSCPYGILTQNGASIYAADAGASDTYVITLPTVPSAYATGMVVRFKANTKNTGAATLNVNSLGAKTIKKDGGVDLVDNDIAASQLVEVIYDGTNFQMLSPIFGCVGQNGQSIYAADAGANDTYVITLSPAPVAYATGMVVRFKANTINTGAATLNVNGLGAITIVKNQNITLSDGDIKANQLVEVIYDGTNFQLISPVSNAGTVTSIATGSGLSGGTITSTGTLTVATGVPLQIVSTVKTSVFTTTSTAFVDVTGLSVSITPSSSSNTVLVFVQLSLGSSTANSGLHANLVRGSTSVLVGDAAASRIQCTAASYNASANDVISNSIVYLDSPATTGSTTYKIQVRMGSGATGAINQSITDVNSVEGSRVTSTITVMEIKG